MRNLVASIISIIMMIAGGILWGFAEILLPFNVVPLALMLTMGGVLSFVAFSFIDLD